MTKTSLLAATTLALLSLALSPGQAASLNRAWVSGHGTDAAGCGAPASPCRTFQYVHDNIIAAGGEIDVLDPAGYGAVTISKALSIVNDGVGTAGVQAPVPQGNAITINAGPNDVVTLRGLDIEGSGNGTTSSNGIVFNSGGGLTVVDCVIRNFTGDTVVFGSGVLIRPTSGTMTFLLSNVTASNNQFAGIAVYTPSSSQTPTVTGVIDRVTAVDNLKGVYVNFNGPATIAVSNSVANDNNLNPFGDAQSAQDGIVVRGSAKVSIDKTSASGNYNGLVVVTPATVWLGRSVIASNAGDGIINSGGAVYTYGDNRINGNGTDVSGALNTADKPQ